MKDGESHVDPPASDPVPRNDFSQTHWTTVLHAQGTSPAANEALNNLCRRYWPPVYAFIRRKWTQHSAHTAEDLTQGFFAEFLKKFPSLDLGPSKGKFRTYLLACLTKYLCKDWERSPSAHELVIPPEEFEKTEPDDWWAASANCSPEHSYDVAWAITLAERALHSLRGEYTEAGKSVLHAHLLPLLSCRSAEGAYAVPAAEMQMSEGALRVAAHQFRRRFGQLLRAEVARTVLRLEDTDDELRYLLALWGANGASEKTGS